MTRWTNTPFLTAVLGLTVWLAFLSAKADRKLTGYYAGYWARTSWEYKFYDNNTFWFKSSGHFGNTLSSGHYSINQDTLMLTSVLTDTIKKEVFYKFSEDKFLIEGDSCIVNLQTGYDYCKTQAQVDKNIWTIRASRQRLKKEDTVFVEKKETINEIYNSEKEINYYLSKNLPLDANNVTTQRSL